MSRKTIMPEPSHSCDENLAKLEAFRARRPDLDPARNSALSFCSLEEFHEMQWCPLCLARARNVYPRWIVGLEAYAAAAKNREIASADAQRFEQLNEKARRNATIRRVKFNPQPGEAVSRVERSRPEHDEWLEGAAEVFPGLKAGD
jgi:hypothetical protein